MSTVAKRYNGKVKAAGGVRSFFDAVAMMEAGAYPEMSKVEVDEHLFFLIIRTV